jgi:hypothetical protein
MRSAARCAVCERMLSLSRLHTERGGRKVDSVTGSRGPELKQRCLTWDVVTHQPFPPALIATLGLSGVTDRQTHRGSTTASPASNVASANTVLPHDASPLQDWRKPEPCQLPLVASSTGLLPLFLQVNDYIERNKSSAWG